MKRSVLATLIVAATLFVFHVEAQTASAAAAASPASPENPVDPAAIQALKKMGAHLQSLNGGRAGGAAQGGGPRGGGGQINNVRADRRTNNVRNTSVNNVNNNDVNVNRNVNVNANGNYHGGGWDNDYHPVATAAAVTATVAVTSAVIGSMVRTVPANCVPVNYGGMIYQQCGTTWYQPQGA